MRSHRLSIAIRFAVWAALISAAAGVGAQSSPWFGIKPTTGLSDPHRAIVDLATVKASPAVIPVGEDTFMELRGERIRRDVDTIVDFSKASHRAGNKVWGRVTGFPSAKATIDWSAQQFKAAGLQQATVQEYSAGTDTAMWWATTWEVKLLGDTAFGVGSKDVVLESSVPTSGSEILGGTITAPLVFVGSITEAKLPDVDVKGKVAVQHIRPARGAFSERPRTVERAKELASRGAIAVLNIVEQTANMHVRDFGNCGAPCFNVGTADGAFVEAAIARSAAANSAVRIQLKLDAKRLTGLKGHNAVGVVPGKSEENIIVNAHADGWYDAAGDNADGLAVLFAMARHFAKPENKPDRTLVFVASGGHHSTGLNGPANFVTMNPALTAKTVLVVNLEHIAQFEIVAGSWKAKANEQPMNFGIDNLAPYLVDLGKRATHRYGFNINPEFRTTVSGDLGGYAPLGVARLQAIHSGPMYHTSGDVLETISTPGLERAARFYTYFVSEAARASRAEINPAKTGR